MLRAITRPQFISNNNCQSQNTKWLLHGKSRETWGLYLQGVSQVRIENKPESAKCRSFKAKKKLDQKWEQVSAKLDWFRNRENAKEMKVSIFHTGAWQCKPVESILQVRVQKPILSRTACVFWLDVHFSYTQASELRRSQPVKEPESSGRKCMKQQQLHSPVTRLPSLDYSQLWYAAECGVLERLISFLPSSGAISVLLILKVPKGTAA